MKNIKPNHNYRILWHGIAASFIFCSLFALLHSCGDDKSDEEGFYEALTIDGILYYGIETFTMTSNEPFVVAQTISAPNFRYLENFVLKVQNGEGETKVQSIEVRIDGNIIINSLDFNKNVNPIVIQISGLTEQSILEIRLEGKKAGGSIELLIEGKLMDDVITDIEGNYYHTVQIGEQWWMAENLKTSRFNDSTSIPIATDITADWSNTAVSIFCWYNFDPGFKDIYGALYNSGVAVSRKACPVGWHVSSNTDWTNMLRILDPNATTYHKESSGIAGGGLKSTGTLEGGNGLWYAPNTGATNVLGLSGIPGGYVKSGSFTGMGYFGVWWLKMEIRVLTYNSIAVNGAETNSYGYSIRCVKDL